MPHYVAIVEDAGPETAIGIWFPDLPGCCSGGDSVEEALRNAEEALALYAEGIAELGRTLPPPRSISVLRGNPEVAADLKDYMIALLEMPVSAAHAAE